MAHVAGRGPGPLQQAAKAEPASSPQCWFLLLRNISSNTSMFLPQGCSGQHLKSNWNWKPISTYFGKHSEPRITQRGGVEGVSVLRPNGTNRGRRELAQRTPHHVKTRLQSQCAACNAHIPPTPRPPKCPHRKSEMQQVLSWWAGGGSVQTCWRPSQRLGP